MEASMSLNALVRLPIISNPKTTTENSSLIRHSVSSTRTFQQNQNQNIQNQNGNGKLQMIIEAKVKRGMMARRNDQRRQPLPALPKIEEDGNPKFVVFIRMSNVYLWYPLSIITGGTTAKIMVAAKDNFLGKYIYKDAIARNLAAVIYKDEKEIIKSAIKQYRVLRSADEFKYGYKLVQSTNLRIALSTTDVIELPPKEELKTVVDKVMEFFGDAKESFGKLTTLDSSTTEDENEDTKEKPNPK